MSLHVRRNAMTRAQRAVRKAYDSDGLRALQQFENRIGRTRDSHVLDFNLPHLPF